MATSDAGAAVSSSRNRERGTWPSASPKPDATGVPGDLGPELRAPRQHERQHQESARHEGERPQPKPPPPGREKGGRMKEERGGRLRQDRAGQQGLRDDPLQRRGPVAPAELEGRERGGHPERRQEVRLAGAPVARQHGEGSRRRAPATGARPSSTTARAVRGRGRSRRRPARSAAARSADRRARPARTSRARSASSAAAAGWRRARRAASAP